MKPAKVYDITREYRWVMIVAVVAAFISSIPYIWGALISPPGIAFTGLTHNIDDGAVYLSWIKQISNGSFLFRNLYTPDIAQGGQFNLLIIVMGLISRMMMLPGVWVFHGVRFLLVILLVWTSWKFFSLFTDNRAERKLFVLLLCFSSGLGWLCGKPVVGQSSVDMWQPEAITFLAMYLNPLFLAGLTLIMGSLYYLVMLDRTGDTGNAIRAGLCLFAIASIHTYDLLTVGCVWAVYFIISCILHKELRIKTLIGTLIAVAISLPVVAYQYKLYSTDLIYQARVNTKIASPSLLSYMEGFGLLLVTAIVGIYVVKLRGIAKENAYKILPVVWMIVGFMVPYIPVAQQRKLIMGIHIPICMLGVIGISWLVAKTDKKWQLNILIALFLVSIPSNVSFLYDDIKLLGELKTVTHYSPYLTTDQIKAIDYIGKNAGKNESVFASPTMALFIPALTGKQVYYGHWSETPDYTSKIMTWEQFVQKNIDDNAKRALFMSTKADYYISESDETLPPPKMLLEDMKQVYQSKDVRVFRTIR